MKTLEKIKIVEQPLDYYDPHDYRPFKQRNIVIYDDAKGKSKTTHLQSYESVYRWYNTPRWSGHVGLRFLRWDRKLSPTEVLETFSQQSLIDEVEKSYSVFLNNILEDFSEQIFFNKNKFWSDKGIVYCLKEFEQNDHEYYFQFIRAGIWKDGKGKEKYFSDWDKTVASVPKSFQTVDKEFIANCLVRPSYIKIANYFLDKVLLEQTKLPEISDILRMSRVELLEAQSIFEQEKSKTPINFIK